MDYLAKRFFTEDKVSFEWRATNIRVDGNCYQGKAPDKIPADDHVAKDNAPLRLSSQSIHSRSEAERYRIPSGYVCAASLAAPWNNAETDFLGIPLTAKSIGIRGAIASSPEEIC